MDMDPLHPPDLATVVERTLVGANISREVWEAQQEDDARPLSETHLTIANIVELLRRHGVLVSELALAERTRDELRARFRGATRRLPALLEASIYGVELTPAAFARSVAELLAQHREAILRVVREQVVRSDVAEEPLREAQIPEADEDACIADLIRSVSSVITSHSEALMLIAMDLDMRIGD